MASLRSSGEGRVLWINSQGPVREVREGINLTPGSYFTRLFLPGVTFACAGVGLLLTLLVCHLHGGSRLAVLAFLGSGFGVVLVSTDFGFTMAFRSLIADKRSRQFQLVLLLAGMTCLVSGPVLALSPSVYRPHEAAVGLSVLGGSFLFGLGMQLGDACGSGTFHRLALLQWRGLVLLPTFMLGSVLGTSQWHMWAQLPWYPPVILYEELPVGVAMALQLGLIAALICLVRCVEWAAHGDMQPLIVMGAPAGVASETEASRLPLVWTRWLGLDWRRRHYEKLEMTPMHDGDPEEPFSPFPITPLDPLRHHMMGTAAGDTPPFFPNQSPTHHLDFHLGALTNPTRMRSASDGLQQHKAVSVRKKRRGVTPRSRGRRWPTSKVVRRLSSHRRRRTHHPHHAMGTVTQHEGNAGGPSASSTVPGTHSAPCIGRQPAVLPPDPHSDPARQRERDEKTRRPNEAYELRLVTNGASGHSPSHLSPSPDDSPSWMREACYQAAVAGSPLLPPVSVRVDPSWTSSRGESSAESRFLPPLPLPAVAARSPPPVGVSDEERATVRSMWLAVCLLAALNVATLMAGGKLWGVSTGITVWGAKLYTALFDLPGVVPLAQWRYWQRADAQSLLEAPLLGSIPSSMDAGLVLGALLCACMLGRIDCTRPPPVPLPLRSWSRQIRQRRQSMSSTRSTSSGSQRGSSSRSSSQGSPQSGSPVSWPTAAAAAANGGGEGLHTDTHEGEGKSLGEVVEVPFDVAYEQTINLHTLVGACMGGILMGYGARLAGGCNIGGFLGGVCSYSLHGWVWLLGAMAGNVLGVHARPCFI